MPDRRWPVKTDEFMCNIMFVLSITFTTQVDISASDARPTYSNKFTLSTFTTNVAGVNAPYTYKTHTDMDTSYITANNTTSHGIC